MALNDRALLETQLAFDGVAAGYGRSNDENPVLVAMRRRALACVRSHVRIGGHVLDLGCGPGADAAALAALGFTVTAIDSSPGMVEQARQRMVQVGCGDRVRVQQLGIHELDALSPKVFDGACSNLGPLNCVPDLPHVARLLSARLRPRAVLVASVIGRFVPWELALYGARGDWGRLRVRFAEGMVAVPLAGQTVWMRYYTPRSFVSVFAAAGFRRASLRCLGLLAPPPYMEGFARRHPSLISALMQVEDRVGAWPLVRDMGDHFLVVLQRV